MCSAGAAGRALLRFALRRFGNVPFATQLPAWGEFARLRLLAVALRKALLWSKCAHRVASDKFNEAMYRACPGPLYAVRPGGAEKVRDAQHELDELLAEEKAGDLEGRDLALLQQVVAKQRDLVALWLGWWTAVKKYATWKHPAPASGEGSSWQEPLIPEDSDDDEGDAAHVREHGEEEKWEEPQEGAAAALEPVPPAPARNDSPRPATYTRDELR